MNLLRKLYQKITHNPPLILAMGFALMVFIGGILLSLPVFTRSGEPTRLVDAFFVATSASCVTGLSPVNTLDHWNTYGHVLIIILIQIGGLGVMSLASLIPLVLGKRIGLRSRYILKDQLNLDSLEGVIVLFKYVLIFTFSVEAIGALLLSVRLIPAFGPIKGLWMSIFHSISAFCNAGFDLFGDSIYPLRADGLVNLTLSALVIIGSLGFVVTSELFRRRSFKKLSTHSKLVIIISLGLLALGTFGFLILEKDGVLVGEGAKASLLEAFFQSTVARTAGFYSVRLTHLKDSTLILLMALMFIGGSPGSTAGGIKTTTIGVILLACLSVIRGEDEPVVFKRRINFRLVMRALAIFMVSLMIILLVSFVLTITEDGYFIDILFETVSALATVGSSRDLTGSLSFLGKVLIIGCMYLGRLGPMSLAFAFGMKEKKSLVKYPEALISIG